MSVAQPAGLRLVTTSIPSFVGRDSFPPQRYFRVGRVAWGNINGFWNSHGVEFAQQVIYPLPDGIDIVAYDLVAGAILEIRELVGDYLTGRKEPWDRNPLPIALFAQADVSDTGGEAVLWSYTVPAGRKLYLASARVAINKVSASTSTTLLTCWIVGPSGYLSLITHHNGAQGLHAQDGLNGAAAIYGPGSSLSASRYAGAGNGVTNFQASMSGFLFDA